MSLASHIETLQEKHAMLEHLIAEEATRPLPDFMHIQDLKKLKLAIKEEIQLLASAEKRGEQAEAS